MDTWRDSTLKMYQERGIGDRGGKGSRPALLIVDMTRGFTDPTAPLGSDLTAVLEAISQLQQATRARGLPIYYTVNLLAPEDPGGAQFLAKVPAIDSLREGTPAVQVDPRIQPLPGETVIVKTVPSAFFGTNLAEAMREQGVDTVIVSGASTSCCVRASATDAMSHGFRTLVVAEAVGDRAQAPHTANLFDMDSKLCDVIPIAEALDYLASLEETLVTRDKGRRVEQTAPLPGAGPGSGRSR